MAEAGWYDDPTGVAGLRYFDGSSWTEHVRSEGHPPSPHEAGTERELFGETQPHPRPRGGRRTARLIAGAAVLLVTGVVGTYALLSDRGGREATAAGDSQPTSAETDGSEVTGGPASEPSTG
jgi:hypothetical protein